MLQKLDPRLCVVGSKDEIDYAKQGGDVVQRIFG
jgi:hypothetical protein